MHFCGLIIVPKDIYLTGDIYNYIDMIMAPHAQIINKEPICSCEMITKQYIEYQRSDKYNPKYDSLESYCSKQTGHSLNECDNGQRLYNSEHLFDYYCVGGKWNAVLTNHSHTDEQLRNLTPKERAIKQNSLTIRKLLKRYQNNDTKYRILFHEEQGTLDYEQILNEHIDDYVVLIDYHR